MVTPEITYAQTSSANAAEVALLIARSREETYGLKAGSPAYRQLVTDVLARPAVESLAELMENPTGFHEAAITPDGEIIGIAIGARRLKVDMLEYLFVDRPYQGQGIGGELMRRFLGWSTKEQMVWIVSDNLPARGFYEHLGFSFAETKSPDGETGLRYIAMKRIKGDNQ
jgi:GNAT superfamily N-acetyltransferase